MRRVLNLILENSLGLLAGAAAGLIWANASLHSYEPIAHVLHFAVNDIGMVFFFALATKEIVEATLPGGALASPRRAALPVLAAVGGMVGPALIYVGLAAASGHGALIRGWAIPCATDIAFSYLVARWIFGARHPAIPFLLLLAIADDAMGLAILAVFYPTGEVRLVEFAGLLGLALLAAWGLKRGGARSFWPYVILPGLISWFAFLRGGLHPALALVPIVPFIPHEPRDLGILAEAEHHLSDPLNKFEQWWRAPVQVILFFFGLVNAGVPLESIGPGTWIVVVALVAGKPLGIISFAYAAIFTRVGELRGVNGRDMLVVGFSAAIGFTVALFFAQAAFPAGSLLAQTKMGALLSFGSAVIAALAAMLLRVGRFAPARG